MIPRSSWSRIAAFLAIVAPSPSFATSVSAPRPLVGYFTAWSIYGRKYVVKNVKDSGAAEKLTHINYAFANVGADLKCAIGDPWADIQKAATAEESVDGVADPAEGAVLRGNLNQLVKLKGAYPHLKLLISIGGYGWSDKFSDAALTAESRKTFVSSCIDMFIKGNLTPELKAPGLFDGIDVDWEFPGVCGKTCKFRPEDTQNFTLLEAELRAQLDALGGEKHYLNTIAVSARESEYSKLELAKLHASVDFMNLMAYDFHMVAETATNLSAALFASPDDPARKEKLWTDAAVAAYLKAGVPAAKLFLGVPFYGHGWEGVPPGPNGDGLYQPVGGPAPARFEKGTEDFRALVALKGTKHVHKQAQGLWTYDPESRIFWTYDDADVLALKAKYANDQKLGGVMFWELSADDESGSLVTALRKGLQ